MSELVLNVMPTKVFEYSPSQLIVEPISQDIEKNETLVRFQLRDETVKKEGYEARDWVDMGSVILPSNILSSLYANGVLNVDLANQILAKFNLQINPQP